MYINIHTHQTVENNFAIINLFPEDIKDMLPEKYYSAGIHPWHVTKINSEEQLLIIEKAASFKNVLAVGEIGLDKLKPEFELQNLVFNKQVCIANNHQKPIIIHCVKAYAELLELLKAGTIKVPVIIHRYSGNKTTAEQLIRFDCYLSFGHELFHTNSKTPHVFRSLPMDRIFLETDDSEKTIQAIYQKASDIKELSLKDISESVRINFQTCFNFNPCQ
jgi:TatD DNase family protein